MLETAELAPPQFAYRRDLEIEVETSSRRQSVAKPVGEVEHEALRTIRSDDEGTRTQGMLGVGRVLLPVRLRIGSVGCPQTPPLGVVVSKPQCTLRTIVRRVCGIVEVSAALLADKQLADGRSTRCRDRLGHGGDLLLRVGHGGHEQESRRRQRSDELGHDDPPVKEIPSSKMEANI